LINPVDEPALPARGFFMGLLPNPIPGQSFEQSYREAAQFAEFAPVWGRPTPYYALASDLAGTWGDLFVNHYIRENGMFPLVQMSFIGPGLTLVGPPDMSGITLASSEWRDSYRESALKIVRAIRPLYFSIGNEVNRWYEKYGVGENNPNGFQNYVSLYNEIYDAVKLISPRMKIFCTFAREIVAENREADLSVLKLFDPDRLDLLVFTSYP